MIFKTLRLSVKEVDTEGRRVSGCGSSFGVRDRHTDIIPFGAYAKTIRERGPGGKEDIFFLDQHNVSKRVNRFKTSDGGILEERKEIPGLEQGGLFFQLFFPPGIAVSDDLLTQYQFEVIRDHSVGIDIVKWVWNAELEAFILQELILWEISAVTWGANDETPALGVKRASDFHTVEAIDEEVSRLRSCLSEGLTDETGKALELGLRILDAKRGGLSAIEKAHSEDKRLKRLFAGEAGLEDLPALREAHHHLKLATLAIERLAADGFSEEPSEEELAVLIDPALAETLDAFNKQFQQVPA